MQFIQFLNKFWHQKSINYSFWELQFLFTSLYSFIIYKIVDSNARMIYKNYYDRNQEVSYLFYKVQLRGHEKTRSVKSYITATKMDWKK